MPEMTVIARARAQAGKEDEMQQALAANATPSRAEEGCLSYHTYRGAQDRQLFMTVERWRSGEDVQRHMATPHVQTLLATIGPLIDGAPEILMLEEV